MPEKKLHDPNDDAPRVSFPFVSLLSDELMTANGIIQQILDALDSDSPIRLSAAEKRAREYMSGRGQED